MNYMNRTFDNRFLHWKIIYQMKMVKETTPIRFKCNDQDENREHSDTMTENEREGSCFGSM